jgi:hypothetical protein
MATLVSYLVTADVLDNSFRETKVSCIIIRRVRIRNYCHYSSYFLLFFFFRTRPASAGSMLSPLRFFCRPSDDLIASSVWDGVSTASNGRSLDCSHSTTSLGTAAEVTGITILGSENTAR